MDRLCPESFASSDSKERSHWIDEAVVQLSQYELEVVVPELASKMSPEVIRDSSDDDYFVIADPKIRDTTGVTTTALITEPTSSPCLGATAAEESSKLVRGSEAEVARQSSKQKEASRLSDAQLFLLIQEQPTLLQAGRDTPPSGTSSTPG
jgi:hypothetical protein